MRSFAVIPTHDRPREFATCLKAIRPQVDHVIVVCHGKDAWNYTDVPNVTRILYEPDGRANISHMWNLGLDEAARRADGSYDIAILNDDAIPGPDWFTTVASTMRIEGANGASEYREPGLARIAGWAFILNGDAGLRADEQFVHWHGDGDLQRQAEKWCFVPDIKTPNTRAGQTSHSQEALNQIRIDGERFDKKWGRGRQ